MADQKMYNAPGLDVELLAKALVQWFQAQQFETQMLQAPQGGWVVQARKGGWTSVIGMSAALNVTLVQQADKLVVQMGAAQWADKAVVGAVGALVFWPALIPAAFGAWKQKQLPEETFKFIDQYIALGGRVTEADMARIMSAPMAAAEAKSEARCPSCNQPVRAGAKFCDNCGASLAVACANCGATLRPGAKFCDSCGARVGG